MTTSNPLVRLGRAGPEPVVRLHHPRPRDHRRARPAHRRGRAPRDDLQSDDLREGDRREPAVRRRDPRPRPTRDGARRRSSSASPWPTCAPRATRSRRCYQATGGGDGLVSLEVSPDACQRHRGHDPRGRAAVARGRPAQRDDQDSRHARGAAGDHATASRPASASTSRCSSRSSATARSSRRSSRASSAGSRRGCRSGPIASVASFFVSRVDGKVDPLLDRLGDPAKLRGRIAIANACAAYRLFEWSLGTPRWDRLAKAGARPQRPLWASTSTKDPRYPDVHYVEALVAPRTREHAAARDVRRLSRPRPAGGADPRGHGRGAGAAHGAGGRWASTFPPSPASSSATASPSSPRPTRRCWPASRPRPARWSAADAAHAPRISRSPGGSSSGWAAGILIGWLAPDVARSSSSRSRPSSSG